MEQTLRKLLELQAVDSELTQLQKLRGNLPQLVEEIREKLAALQKNYGTEQETLDSTIKQRLGCEGNVKSLNEQLAKYNEQLYNVKNNKEYDALTDEIETKEKEIGELETRILEFYDIEETLKTSVQNLNEQIEVLKQELEAKEIDLNARLEQTSSKEKVLDVQRKELATKLSRPIYSTYERIRKGKNGLAVAGIENGICTGCSGNLPPQIGLEIRKMNQLIYCQTCGRFLIWHTNGQESETADHQSNPEQIG